MNVTETIRTFLEFFGDRGHQVVPSSSLVPPDSDPVLFTTAGMHPLTRYLEGRPHPQGRRLAGVQRCLRTTDLDEVGDDRHLTVFQMLGSWSLGDYDGPQSLRWGWELLTDGFGIGRNRLHATVFGGDDQVGGARDRLRGRDDDIRCRCVQHQRGHLPGTGERPTGPPARRRRWLTTPGAAASSCLAATTGASK